MVWRVPKMWKGGDCWIVGGGPSVPLQFGVPEDTINQVLSGQQTPQVYSQYMKAIHTKHVIGINAAYLIGGWMDMIFFGDKRFFLENEQELVDYGKPIVSCHSYFNGSHTSVKYLLKDNSKPSGISDNISKVSWNQNSGAAAISVAAHAGVKRIILLGFDMALGNNGNGHWHTAYRKNPRNGKKGKTLPFHRHIRGFGSIAQDAERKGIEILNASPDSTITVFKKVTVQELLNNG